MQISGASPYLWLPFALQVLGGCADPCNAAGRRDVVSGDFVPQKQQNVCIINGTRRTNIFRLRREKTGRKLRHSGLFRTVRLTLKHQVTHKFAEEWRAANISGLGIPWEEHSIWSVYVIPKSASFLKVKGCTIPHSV